MIAALWVDVSCAFLIVSYPDVAVLVFTKGEDGKWKGDDMLGSQDAMVVVYAIKTVFVGANPCDAVLALQHTGDTVLTNEISIAKAKAHIAKVNHLLRLHEYAFLKHAHPDVAFLVFQNTGNFCLGKVHTVAEERVVVNISGLRAVCLDAKAVATDINEVVATDVDATDREVAHSFYL